MKKITGVGAIACAMLFASNASFAEGTMAADHAGEIMVRARAVQLNWQNSSNPVAGVAAQNKTIPEVDLSYFFTSNIAAELILTYPQKVNINLSGTPLGSVKALPPILTLQYHFAPDSQSFRPYVGAGINYTNFSSVSLAAGATPLNVKKSSTGLALQAGFDVPITENLTFNLDLKKAYIKTDVSAATSGAYVTTLNVDPYLVGVGLGWKFF